MKEFPDGLIEHISVFVVVFQYHLMGRPGETTGPGQYDQKGSIGKQNEAYKDTLPAFSFGNCTRDNANKVSQQFSDSLRMFL